MGIFIGWSCQRPLYVRPGTGMGLPLEGEDGLRKLNVGRLRTFSAPCCPSQPNLLSLFYSYLPHCPLSCSKCLLAIFSNFLALTISLTRSEEGARERGRGMEREELFLVFCVYCHKVLGGRNLVYAMGELCELEPPGC